ncbi:hypothetical protein ATS72_013610 [Pseudoalteromonas sp. 13-15]|nr:hypothetical protein ATS72_013610 [Pseudoalteromonas sp. 13-15]SIO05452.1 hypothetical protein SAMN05878071_2727 [Pseudoalteromonas marina]
MFFLLLNTSFFFTSIILYLFDFNQSSIFVYIIAAILNLSFNKKIFISPSILVFIVINTLFLLSIDIYFMLGGDFTSWRAITSFGEYIQEFSILNILNILFFLFLSFLPNNDLNNKNETCILTANGRLYFFYSVVAIVLFIPLGTVTRHSFLVGVIPGGTILMSLYITFSLLAVREGLLKINQGSKFRLQQLLFFLVMLSSLILALNGFRAPFVMVVICSLLFFFENTKRKKLSKYIFLGGLIYLLLIFFQILRGLELGALELIEKLMNNELNFSDLMEHFGGHEQNILYSYFIVTKDTSMSMGKDYFISLVQILPSFISDPLVGSNRVNEVISSIASPEHFIENNLNLGAFFIVEAYLNFSWFGVFFLPVIFMYLIYLFDKKSYKDRFILSSTIPFFIYYGFGFGLKIIFYVVVFDYLFRKLLKGNKVE